MEQEPSTTIIKSLQSVKFIERNKLIIQEIAMKKKQLEIEKEMKSEAASKLREKLKPVVLPRYNLHLQNETNENQIKREQEHVGVKVIYRKASMIRVIKTTNSLRRQSTKKNTSNEDEEGQEKRKQIRSRRLTALKTLPPLDRGHKLEDKHLESPSDPRSFPNVTDVNDWLKKNRLPANSKVFCVSSMYRKSIRKSLLKIGWIENKDQESYCFHFKFTLKGSQIPFKMLQKYQIVNHFQKVQCLTTKIGLLQSLRDISFFSNKNIDSIFPRAFDCNEKWDYEEFTQYYKLTRAESILKRYICLAHENRRNDPEYRDLAPLIKTALKVTIRRLMNLDEMVDSQKDWTPITLKEWDIISKGEVTEEDLAKMMIKQNLKRQEKNENRAKKKKKKSKRSKKGDSSSELNINVDNNDEQNNIEDNVQQASTVQLSGEEVEVENTLKKLHEVYPQTRINGMGNIWILKPSGLSRGRGIKLYSSLVEINHHLTTKDFSYILQKYIENPLCYKRKKIDIRQWVVVAGWNPLTILFYDECYIRISSSDFTLSNIKNRFIHLTNNSVNKKSKNFVEEEGFLSQDEFRDWIETDYFEGAFNKIQEDMKSQVIASILCCQDRVSNRPNSLEIFGFDFCLDEDLGVWLIEVNASPDFSFSSVTSYTNLGNNKETSAEVQ